MRLGSTLISLAAIMAAGSLSGPILAPAHACDLPSTSVSDVYPTGEMLPENLLRFYVYFSAPMGQDDILPSITVLDESGDPLEGVFLSNRYDLWSADRTRLTLLLDPGRVKTGLAANQAMGRALVAGRTYHLRISQTALDATGCGLSAAHSVSFQAIDADVTSPTPEDWVLSTPRTGARDPITVTVDGPIDHLSLAYRLRVLRPDGTPVAGSLALEAAETIWRFTPREPWGDTAYHLRIDPLLEDLAGNRMDAVFDLDLGSGAPSMAPSDHRMISFTPLP
ncbi:MAG: hypothetical protein NXH88_01205 [Hyphomonas sp.]|nr:hypothetical protein [Hyphomonas sp.]